jgi:hypothetical protein
VVLPFRSLHFIFFPVRVDDILTSEGNNLLWAFYRMGHNRSAVGHASFAGGGKPIWVDFAVGDGDLDQNQETTIDYLNPLCLIRIACVPCTAT